MPTIHATLSLAQRALMVQQGAMAVTGDNIANANTPGYARKRVELREVPGINIPQGFLGGGVDLSSIERLRDPFIEQQFRRGLGQSGRLDSESRQLGLVESTLGELGEAGLASALNRFWNAWHDLAAEPSTAAARSVVAEAARSLVHKFNEIGTRLDDQTASINQEITSKVNRINLITGEIAELNRTLAGRGNIASGIDDRRSLLLDELARIADVRYRIDDEGRVNVYISGTAVVEGVQTRVIAVEATEDNNVRLVVHSAGDTSISVTDGELGALFEVVNGEMAELRARLGAVARALAQSVNRIHREGYTLNGATGVDFFNPDTTGIADISLSEAVEGDSAVIVASADGSPGDNRIALAIADLERASHEATGGNTIADYYNATAAWLGAKVQEAELRAEGAGYAVQQLVNWRESVSGVSLDEEMTLMVRYQHAFNAAAKMVSAVNNMMESLLAM